MEEGFLYIVECKLVVQNLVEVFFCLKDRLVVLWLTGLSHHACTRRHHFHLLDRFVISKHQSQNAIKSINQEESPKEKHIISAGGHLPWHGADIGGIKCCYVEPLLEHLLKLNTQWEGNLCSDKALEDWANHLEGHHMHNRLQILFKHIVHHIGIAHHIHLLCLHIPCKESLFLIAEISFSYFHRALRNKLRELPQLLRPWQSLSFTSLDLISLLKHFWDVNLVFRCLFRHVSIGIKHSLVKGFIREFGRLKQRIPWLIHVAHAEDPEHLDCNHQNAERQKDVISDSGVKR